MRAPPTYIEWSEANVATLKRMWDEGQSSGAIALEMGATRNAIIGKVRRLKLGSHSISSIRAIRPERGRGQAKAPALRHRVAVAPPGPAPEPAPVGGVALLDLGGRQCRWPLWGMGRPEEYRFCGASRQYGSAYCETHRHLSVKPRVREAVDAVDA